MLLKRTSEKSALRKMLCFILSILMLFGFFVNNSYAGEPVPIGITVGLASANVGDTVQVPVSISQNGVVAGYQFSIKYDPTKVTAVDVIDGITAPVMNLNNAQAGEIKFSFASANALSNNGDLFVISFRVSSAAPAGSADIMMENEFLNDENGNALAVNKTNGKITITANALPTLSPTAVPTPTQAPISTPTLVPTIAPTTGSSTIGSSAASSTPVPSPITITSSPTVMPTPTVVPIDSGTKNDATVTVNIGQQNTALSNLVNNTDLSVVRTEEQKTQAAQTILSNIAQTITEVKDNTAAVQAVSNIANTLAAAKLVMTSLNNEKEKIKIVDSIKDIVKNTQFAVEKLVDAKASVNAAKTLISSTAEIINSTDKNAEAIKELKKSLVEVTQKVVEKASTVTIEDKLVSVKDNVVSAQIDKDAIKGQIQAAKDAISQVKDELSKVADKDEMKTINTALTINIPVTDNAVRVNADIPADVVQAVKDDGLDGIKVNMNNVGFTVTPDTFAKAKAGEKISLAAQVLGNVAVSAPQSVQKIEQIPVMEFSASVGGSKVEKFVKPMEVTFDVSGIDTSKYTEQDLSKLTVYLFNESTGKWEPVGGKYDPVTRKVSVLRSHFSKYTVMKPDKSFSDISNNWAKNEISLMLNKGIINETAKFEPNKKITRAEFAAWVVRLFGFDGKGMSNNFKDVVKNNPFYNQISAAASEGIINGTSKTTFSPDKNITREEMSTILCRALTKYKGTEVLSSSASASLIKGIKDSKTISPWAVNAVSTVYKNGIVNGYSDKSFKPKSNLTKSEAAALIYRIFNNI